MHPAVDTRFAMHPLSGDEQQTFSSIMHLMRPDSDNRVFPTCTHGIDPADGHLRGFVYACSDAHLDVSQLPLSRETFHGHTAVECTCGSQSDIVRLLQQDAQELCRQMKAFVDMVCQRAKVGPVATLTCKPDSEDAIRTRNHEVSMDSRPWVPEMPQTIGLYHAFVRGHNHDTRVHKLFIVVSGGCSQASDEFYNSILDCHGKVSAYDCATAEESWWLRRACYRARCRLLADCASHFGLQIFKIQDTKSCSDCKEEMAVATVDTVTHDLLWCPASGDAARRGAAAGKPVGQVVAYNSCTGVAHIQNGVLCAMHPSEGFWIFQGVHNRSTYSNNTSFGKGWSKHPEIAMPTSVLHLTPQQDAQKGRVVHNTPLGGQPGVPGHAGSRTGQSAGLFQDALAGGVQGTMAGGFTGNAPEIQKKAEQVQKRTSQGACCPLATVTSSDAPFIIRINPITQERVASRKNARYQKLDHAALNFIADTMGWSRERGVVELMPLVVAERSDVW